MKTPMQKLIIVLEVIINDPANTDADKDTLLAVIGLIKRRSMPEEKSFAEECFGAGAMRMTELESTDFSTFYAKYEQEVSDELNTKDISNLSEKSLNEDWKNERDEYWELSKPHTK